MIPESPLAVARLSEHIAIGINSELQKRGGCFLILALDFVPQSFTGPSGGVCMTLCGTN